MPTERHVNEDRLAFVYAEAIRGLAHQERVVESLNTRAGNLIFATAFVSSLLGSRALADGLGVWDWLATFLLLAGRCARGAHSLALLQLHVSLRSRGAVASVRRRRSRRDDGRDSPHAALRIKNDMVDNWRTIQRIRIALQWALVFLIVEIFAWLLSIAGN